MAPVFHHGYLLAYLKRGVWCMTSVAVVDLSGVGHVLAGKLNEMGLYTTEDLLRSNRVRLAKVLVGASIAQVRGWQAISELLEIDGMTLVRAEALNAGGINTLDELAKSKLSRLRGVAGIGAPTEDELVGWMTDAILLRNTGTLNGTVVGHAGAPLEGVSATCMGIRATSDARGRFRIRRLPLGRELLVHLEHPEYNEKSVSTRSIAPRQVLLGERFRMSRVAVVPGGGAPAATRRVLSELRGDRLPPVGGAAVTTRVQQGAPAENDLLRVFEVPAAGGARAVSRWLDYAGGVFVIRSYRLAAADVGGGGAVAVGDHIQYSAGQWRRVALDHHRFQALRRALRDQQIRPVLPENPTSADVNRAIQDYMAARERDRADSHR